MRIGFQEIETKIDDLVFRYSHKEIIFHPERLNVFFGKIEDMPLPPFTDPSIEIKETQFTFFPESYLKGNYDTQ